MEERRVGSKSAFVVAWLLTLGLVLAVGPLGSPASTVECNGADCVDAHLESRTDRDAQSREWRGRDPEICLADRCDEGPPMFCHLARSPIAQDVLNLPRHPDPCAREPGFRTAPTRA